MAESNPSTYCYQGIDWTRSLMGDDIVLGSNQSAVNVLLVNYYMQDPAYRNSSNLSNTRHWFGYAQGINDANKLLKYSNYLDIKTSDDAKNTFYKSDAYARVIRAFSYMSLMEEYTPFYGSMKNKEAANSGLSIYRTYDPVRKGVARSNAKETWEFIKGDLDTAYNDLRAIDVDITTNYAAGELEDIDLSVVDFLRARAGLLIEDWSYCAEACRRIVESKKYSFIAKDNWGGRLVNNGKDGDGHDKLVVLPETNAFTALSKNPETIFGLKMKSTNDDDSKKKYFFKVANIFGTYSANTGDSGSQALINDVLYGKIVTGDCRKAAFIEPTTSFSSYKFFDGSVGKVQSLANLKFAATCGLSDEGQSHIDDATKCQDMEYTKFRYSEVILMYTEALMHGAGTDPTVYINQLRTARGAEPLESVTQSDIECEWSIEMWGEGGREYYNHKRWGKDIKRASESNHWSKNGYTVANMTIPFPQREQEDNKEWAEDTTNL